MDQRIGIGEGGGDGDCDFSIPILGNTDFTIVPVGGLSHAGLWYIALRQTH